MHLVFYSIPYRGTSEIGGLDGDFDPEFSAQPGKVSPPGQKTAIFRDF